MFTEQLLQKLCAGAGTWVRTFCVAESAAAAEFAEQAAMSQLASCRIAVRATSCTADPRFVSQAARRQHRVELEEIIRTWARGQTRQRIWDGLRDLGYFGAPVLSLGEVMEDPHIKARQAFIDRDHPTAGPAIGAVDSSVRNSCQYPRRCAGDRPAYRRNARRIVGFEFCGVN